MIAKAFSLTKDEFNYLAPALHGKLYQSGDNYHFISHSIEELSDMLYRLKGHYDNFTEGLPNMVAYRCSKNGDLEPFRKAIINF